MTKEELRQLWYNERNKYWSFMEQSTNDLISKYNLGEVYCGISVGLGWIPILETALSEMKLEPNQLIQVKQKFCQLVIYHDKDTPEARLIVQKAVEQASVICEICGGPRVYTGYKMGSATCDECDKTK